MDSVNLEVLKASARWIESGRRVLLVTVVRTWGSSPRPEGAMLAILDGRLGGGFGFGRLHRGRSDRPRAIRARNIPTCGICRARRSCARCLTTPFST
ncbi:XdhC family protein [Paraburkholderia caledonica]|nr:XdhC family protein [Paraburkholderia caledonica]